YATNCPNFNLDAIVCEPSYEIKDFGLGHEQASPRRPANNMFENVPIRLFKLKEKIDEPLKKFNV
ncbi:MAG: hypothetical protein KHZ78_07385, partial [Peptoniphilus sp. oral taxon 375]|nr:hypothetical protein [Peptoniphilus sp. oral taxon 375]